MQNCSKAAVSTTQISVMLSYLSFDTQHVLKSVVDCLIRINTIGGDTLINSDTVRLNTNGELEFEIHCGNLDADCLYDESISIMQNNFRFVTLVLMLYNKERVNYWRSLRNAGYSMYDIDILDAKAVSGLWDICADIKDVSKLIYVIQNIRVYQCSECT